MKQIPSKKFNVAWFTLAECVSRGEKVRAMSLYRLLTHSIKDNAFSQQLKGDLLLAFKDSAATELYEEAADLYIKDNRFLEAIGVYEHLTLITPENWHYIKSLIKLYKKLEIPSKYSACVERLFQLTAKLHDNNEIFTIISQMEEASHEHPTSLHQRYIQYILQNNVKQEHNIHKYGEKIIDTLILDGKNDTLDYFLNTIESIDDEYALMLYKHIEKIKKR